MSVSSRRRPCRQRRRGRGHSPPALPPGPGPGPGPGPAPARPFSQRAGERARGRGAALLFVRRAEERRDAGQAASRSPPLSSGPGAEKGPRGCVGAPLSAASRAGSILCEPRSPVAPAAARVPGGAPLPPAGLWRGPALCLPACPGGRAAGGRQALGAAGPGWPGESGDARRGRPPRTHWADSSPDRAVGPGPPGHLRGEEGMALASPQSGLRVKNAAIWRLAVPGLAPKVEIAKIRHLFRQVFFNTTDNTVVIVFHDNGR
ncbi:nuclear transcription factor Y subunit beta isoform X1 [Saimiri boliviensis]|uniref:nuclear transcription factor Y subunit beta isoform X1 n=1 Tax=Saimiri boliviensis TaxID=27679 RepID=UPI003D7864E8